MIKPSSVQIQWAFRFLEAAALHFTESNKTPQNELNTATTRLGNYWRSKP
jgi:hypothetical protein